MAACQMLGVLILASCAAALQNGLARTPPMGWLSWQRFRCNIDCVNYPRDCISERLYMEQADRLAADGYKDVGYEYVNIDDCWSTKERDPKTLQLVPDPVRFPHGMKYLADYVHSKGLKLGIYGDMGLLTCGGYPGNKFTMETDAQSYKEWGIDSLKMDGCYSATSDFTVAYPIMEFYLNKTGRPILFSCSWPAYEQKGHPNYPRIAEYCNIWRNFDDIDDSWDSVKSIIQYYGDNKNNFSAVAGPGNFNDPDMIIVGNKGLSYSESQAQMALWSMMAAPLYISADLRNITPQYRDLLLNKRVLAINQDKLGIMGKRMFQLNNVQGWVRKILPEGSYAIAILNTGEGGSGIKLSVSLSGNFGIKETGPFILSEVFDGGNVGTYNSTTEFKIYVDVSSVFFGRLTPTA